MHENNLPEFEDLAAMESGYAWRPITVRRGGTADCNQVPSAATFVSGNYFRVFGLSPAAGRLFLDSDDQKRAPVTAVMSCEAPGQGDYARATRRLLGSTFYIKPATGYHHLALHQRASTATASTPITSKYYLPMNTMDPVIGAPYFTDRNTEWAYIIGRVRPGTSIPAL